MSEEETTQQAPETTPEASPEEKVESKSPPKPKAKPTPKKKATPVKRAAKKPTPKKAVKKAKKAAKKKGPVTKRPARDDARKVANASDGKLTTDQVRVLRALRKGRPTGMPDLKKGCGMDPEAPYAGSFLKAIHSLQESRLIKIDTAQESRAHTYSITEKGKAAIEKAEASAKEKEKKAA